MSATLTLKDQIKEAAVHDHRHWVRIAAGCNNRCTFCLDSEAQNGSLVPDEEVRAEINRGREQLGATRLILSGGEASINHRFPEYIRLGKELGYSKIQTVTNGRMYSYPKFCEKVLAAGLDEVTFSLHGHTPQLHDTLVGIPGAFVQLVKGMVNLMGRCIVNVDVVLNKQNYKHVHDIVDFCMKLGVHEFDLLHITPFGRAYPANKDFLMYNVDHAAPYLRKVFDLADKGKVFVWTNRFPVQHLEGYERLIQDPHKLFDEINGRREMFEDYLKNDRLMPCHGDRCQYCFLDRYCQRLIRTREQAAQPHQPHLQLHAAQAAAQLARVKHHTASVVEWLAQTPAELAGLELTENLKDAEVWVDVAQGAGLADALAARTGWNLGRVAVHDRAGLEEALSMPDVTVEVRLNKTLQDFLLRHPELLRQHRHRLVISLENFETLGETDEQGADALAFARAAADSLGGIPTQLPPCFTTPGAPREEKPAVLPAALLDENGALNITACTHHDIVHHYTAKSLRCQKCLYAQNCAGLQIQYIRRHGFGQMQPVTN